MDETKQSLTDHLGELRSRLIKAIGGILITMLGALAFSPQLLDYSIEPLQDVLQDRNRVNTVVVQADEVRGQELVAQLEELPSIRFQKRVSAIAELASLPKSKKRPVDLLLVSTDALGTDFIKGMDVVDAIEPAPFVAYLVKGASDPMIAELRFEGVTFLREVPRAAVLKRIVRRAAGAAGKSQSEKLVVLSPLEPFFAWIKIALVVGLFLACPVWLYQAWMFVAPGLYEHEKKFALPIITSGSLLFVAGGAFAYFLMFPLMFDVLVNQMMPETLNSAFTVDKYLGLLLRLTVAFGVVFELPLAITMLSMVGIVTPEGLKKYRKYALIVSFIVGAFLTPADPLSQVAMALPLIIFYEVGIIASTLVTRRRRKANEESSDVDSYLEPSG